MPIKGADSNAGTPTENCQAVRDAILGIAGATSTTPYLVQLEPGVYDCGTGAITMFPYISIEGAGTATPVRGFGDYEVNLASNTELRSLKALMSE